jgi:phosphoglycerate dehydrogenase-like enzyme
MCCLRLEITRLRWVQATWAGVEPLLDPSLRRDYILTNARGVFGDLMSEYVFGYLLLYERRILERNQAQKERRWDGSVTGTLRGKTIGLLGVGSIGAHLAATAKHFGMTVRGYTRVPAKTAPMWMPTIMVMNCLTLPKGWIIWSACCQILQKRVISWMQVCWYTLPKHAIFLNVGRGSAVDETALVQALEKGKIAGAVLDVFEQEPLPESHPFWTTPNLWITFHTAAPSFPADITNLFVENYHRFINGQELKYQVDFERGYY